MAMQEQKHHKVDGCVGMVSLQDYFWEEYMSYSAQVLFAHTKALAISSCETPVDLSQERRVTLRMSWTM
jgi:hypothetical protein